MSDLNRLLKSLIFMLNEQEHNDRIGCLSDSEIEKLFENKNLPKGPRTFGYNHQWLYLSNHKAVLARMEATNQNQGK
jgi:hypothetical protein